MSVERVRPIKQFRVLQAYGPYVKGQLIQPTGMYRDVLVRRGVIEEVKDAAAAQTSAPAGPRAASAPENRMVPDAEAGEQRGGLFSRRGKSRR